MRHRSLMGAGIRCVASNAHHVSCAQEVIDDVWKTLIGEVDRHYSRGRRIAPNTMRSLYESFDEIVMNNLQIVDCRMRETKATATRPKGASFDVSYVGVRKKKECDGRQDIYELFTLRIVLKSKVVKLHLHPHPIAFQYHAAERLVERVDGETLPFEMIAAELADWSLALWEVFRTSKNYDQILLSLPCMEGKGMLAGRFEKLPMSPISGTTNNRSGCFSHSANFGDDKVAVFVIKTFVGSDNLRPEQVSALNRLARWRLLNKSEYMAARDASLWDVDFYDDGYVVPEMGSRPRADLVAILNDPTFKRAMTTKTLEAGMHMPRNSQADDELGRRPAWTPTVLPHARHALSAS